MAIRNKKPTTMNELEITSEWNLADGVVKQQPAKVAEGDGRTSRSGPSTRSAENSEAVYEAVRVAYKTCCAGKGV